MSGIPTSVINYHDQDGATGLSAGATPESCAWAGVGSITFSTSALLAGTDTRTIPLTVTTESVTTDAVTFAPGGTWTINEAGVYMFEIHYRSPVETGAGGDEEIGWFKGTEAIAPLAEVTYDMIDPALTDIYRVASFIAGDTVTLGTQTNNGAGDGFTWGGLIVCKVSKLT